MTHDAGIVLHRTRFAMAELLTSTLEPLAARAARKSVTLEIAARGVVPEVTADRRRIAWCVATLAGTSLRYLRGVHPVGIGSRILVEVSADEARPERIAVSVSDDGPGIPAEELVELFEPHVGLVQGDALSLSLIREIVAAHAGSIQVNTQQGRANHGTTVTIRLPVGAGAA